MSWISTAEGTVSSISTTEGRKYDIIPPYSYILVSIFQTGLCTRVGAPDTLIPGEWGRAGFAGQRKE